MYVCECMYVMYTSLLVPENPGMQPTPYYIVTVGTSRPVQAGHTHLRTVET